MCVPGGLTSGTLPYFKSGREHVAIERACSLAFKSTRLPVPLAGALGSV